MLRTIKQSFNYQLFPLGVAQCLMCLWTHFGQKKTFDCSLRRDVGRFRLGCSLHLSYRHGTSPRLSRSFQKQPLTSHRNGMTPSYSGLKNFPKLDKSKLSSSLSSLRCLGDTGLASGFPGSQMASTRTQGNGVTRSSNVLHNTQSGGSWLWSVRHLEMQWCPEIMKILCECACLRNFYICIYFSFPEIKCHWSFIIEIFISVTLFKLILV